MFNILVLSPRYLNTLIMKLQVKTETMELKVLQFAVDASRREVVDTGMWVLVLIKALCASI